MAISNELKVLVRTLYFLKLPLQTGSIETKLHTNVC